MNNWWWAKCETKQNFIVTSTSNHCSQSDWPWMIRVMYSPPKKDFYTTCFFLYFFASLLPTYFACTYQNKMYVVDVVVVVHQSFCCLNFFAWYSLQYFLFSKLPFLSSTAKWPCWVPIWCVFCCEFGIFCSPNWENNISFPDIFSSFFQPSFLLTIQWWLTFIGTAAPTFFVVLLA